MSVLSKTMTGFLGTSWQTSLLGYAQLLLVSIYSGWQASNGNMTSEGWIQLIGSAVIAVALRVAKDHNVSNSPVPVAPATVSAADVSKPNPNKP